MKVKAIKSFSDIVHGTRAAGAVFDLPEGADWLRAGLVEVVHAANQVGVVFTDEQKALIAEIAEPEAPKRGRRKKAADA